MRPTPAASTLSEFRWRMWAVCRRWVAPVCAGTARAWRTPDDGLLGGAFWPFQDRAFPLGALPLPLPSPLAFVGSLWDSGRCSAGAAVNAAWGNAGKWGVAGCRAALAPACSGGGGLQRAVVGKGRAGEG